MLRFAWISIFVICLPLHLLAEDCEDEVESIPSYLIPFSLGDCGDITYKPGLRIQVRYTYDDEDHNNDFFIRRVRFKAGGDAFGIAKYYAELKLDETGRFCKDPKAKMENAWLDFKLCQDYAYIRVGLYDIPFSRNALTSDSKLLFMDRSLIKTRLTELGLADNTIGLLLHGRPYGGHLEYYVGIFDNEKFEKIGANGTKQSDELMPAGRLVWNFFDPAKPPDGYADYKGSYLCKGHRLALGVNAAYLGSAHDGDDKFDLFACGADLFYNWYRYTFQAEYDWFDEDDTEGYGWYIQGGYLFYYCFEFALRYQELEPAKNESNNKKRWTSIGLNAYIREHNLKVQTDYTFRNDQGEGTKRGLFQIQLQLDF